MYEVQEHENKPHKIWTQLHYSFIILSATISNPSYDFLKAGFVHHCHLELFIRQYIAERFNNIVVKPYSIPTETELNQWPLPFLYAARPNEVSNCKPHGTTAIKRQYLINIWDVLSISTSSVQHEHATPRRHLIFSLLLTAV